MTITGLDKLSLDKFFEDIWIQRSTDTTDSWGNPVQAFANHHSIRGRLRPLSAKEVYTSNKDTAQTTHRLYTKSTDLLETDRINYGGKIYEVTGIINPMTFGWFYQVECRVWE